MLDLFIHDPLHIYLKDFSSLLITNCHRHSQLKINSMAYHHPRSLHEQSEFFKIAGPRFESTFLTSEFSLHSLNLQARESLVKGSKAVWRSFLKSVVSHSIKDSARIISARPRGIERSKRDNACFLLDLRPIETRLSMRQFRLVNLIQKQTRCLESNLTRDTR